MRRFDDLDWRPGPQARLRSFEAKLLACCVAGMALLAALSLALG